ncbi:MAG: PLDc N-terminal domain-containing protein, partial [Firmicutes bacterium]|nr:PLDc N-terminal domain-containing protein [Bacillota bacterium]
MPELSLSQILVFLYIVNFILTVVIFFVERKNPASTWAWMLVVLFIPIIGFFFYMVLGRSGKRERMFAEKERYDYELYYDFILKDDKYWEMIRDQKKALAAFQDSSVEYLAQLAYLNLNSGMWITENNIVEHFTNGRDKFNSLIEDIRAAKSFIHME